MDMFFFAAVDTSSEAYRAGHIAGYAVGVILLFAIPVVFVVALVNAIRQRRAGWVVTCLLTGLATLGLAGLFTWGVVRGFRETAGLDLGLGRVGLPVVSSDGATQIAPPSHWRKLPGLNEEATLQLGHPGREEYLIVLTDSKEEFDGTLAEHTKFTTGHLMDALENATLSEPETLTVGGLPALRYEIVGRIEGLDIVYLQTTVEGRHGFHQVLTWTLAPRRAQAWPILREATDSFQETAPEAPAPAPSGG